MNQLENEYRKKGSAGRSRARGSDRGPGASSRGSARSSGRSTSAAGRSSSGSRGRSQAGRSGQAGRSNAMNTARRNSSHHRRKGPDYGKIAIGGVILLILIAAVVFMVKTAKTSGDDKTETTETQTTEAEMTKAVSVDGVDITGMSREEARNAILKKYPWNMSVTYGEESYQVTDLMAARVDGLLGEIYSGEPKESYTLDTDGFEEAAAAEAKAAAAKWNRSPQNGSIDSYDKESDSFVFAGEKAGFAIDEEKLAADILKALADKRFDAQIAASGSEVQPEITQASAKEKYKTISTFTTNTTANKNRNTNVRLAAEAINGTIIKPGEEFSFNGVVGRRTEAKGYKGAAAYNNGEVVQEIGGGVCQVSTTLYNAVVRAGLEISYRRSHTFEPSYITPGQDATVSYDQPDFRFINNSKAAIGIKASYSNQKMTVSVYGIPILEDGVKWDLRSEKVETLDPPAPTYEEDQTLEPGVEKTKSAGTQGSRWVTYKVVTKDGKTVSEEVDHKTTYKGHAPVILRNTSGVVLPPDETTPVESSTVPTVDGMPDGYVPEETVPGPAGNGGENQGPGVPTTPAPTTPAPTAPSGTTAAPAPGPDGGQSQTQSQGPGPGQPEANTPGGPTITPIAPNPGN